MNDTNDITSEHVLLSDGGHSATTVLGASLAASVGHYVEHIVYPGSGHSPNANHYEIDLEHLKESNRYLMRANKNIHRSWPRQQIATDNALRRDMWMVKWAHRVYIVGRFTQDASLLKINTDVAWAAQIYVDRFLYDDEPTSLCELYMFDMKSEAWWLWNQNWTMINSIQPAHGVYTVLGLDKLTTAGRTALYDLWPTAKRQ